MRFSYRAYRLRVSGGQFQTVYRPVLPLRLLGAETTVRRLALVDTGADFTLLPKALAPALGVLLEASEPMAVTGVGGGSLLAQAAFVTFELRTGQTVLQWKGKAYFAEQDFVLLGTEGFLEFFAVSFDVSQRSFEVVPNHDFPGDVVE